jgi:hypothetical protein
MAGNVKTCITFKKIRLALFLNSYAYYRISQSIREKYKFDNKLEQKELRRKYFNKKVIPEISRLSRVLNLPHKPLWESIVLDKTFPFNKKIPDKEKIRVYLSIESELIKLVIAKQNKSDYVDPDYEIELALLSIAIERAVGNALKDVEDDFDFAKQSEKLKRRYIYWYYGVAYKYKLPTTRIIPFILRLIKQ